MHKNRDPLSLSGEWSGLPPLSFALGWGALRNQMLDSKA